MDPHNCCETFVTLLRSSSPQLLPDPDSNSTSQTQIELSAEFKRIYESRGTPPESPAQMAAESHDARFLIPADNKDSIQRTVSQLNIPLHPQPHHIHWKRISASNNNNKPLWIPVQSREGLISCIVEALWQMVESDSAQGKRVDAQLKIAELRRVSEKEYVGIWRDTRMGFIMKRVERMLIRYQQDSAWGSGRVMSVDEVGSATEELVRTVDGMGNVGLLKKLLDRGTIDLIARRAFEALKQVLGSAIDNALVVVKEEEEEDGGECSICLGPILTAECAVVRLPKCGHCFHRQCLTPWLANAPTCPLCRSCPLPSTFGTSQPKSATYMTCLGLQLDSE